MKRHPKFSFERLRGIISKEFMQMRRDRLTFAMMLGIVSRGGRNGSGRDWKCAWLVRSDVRCRAAKRFEGNT